MLQRVGAGGNRNTNGQQSFAFLKRSMQFSHQEYQIHSIQGTPAPFGQAGVFPVQVETIKAVLIQQLDGRLNEFGPGFPRGNHLRKYFFYHTA
jgi:hypothetical protein